MSCQKSLVEKITKMEEYLADLQKIRPESYEKYQSDLITRYAVERIIQLVVDLALDINNLTLSYLQKPPTADYLGSFIALADCSVLDQSFAFKIAPSTGLRNRLVREYKHLNPEVVFKSINQILDLYSQYLLKINSFIRQRQLKLI